MARGEERAVGSGGEMRRPQRARDDSVPGEGQERRAQKAGSGKRRGKRRGEGPRGLGTEVQGPRGRETARVLGCAGTAGAGGGSRSRPGATDSSYLEGF